MVNRTQGSERHQTTSYNSQLSGAQSGVGSGQHRQIGVRKKTSKMTACLLTLLGTQTLMNYLSGAWLANNTRERPRFPNSSDQNKRGSAPIMLGPTQGLVSPDSFMPTVSPMPRVTDQASQSVTQSEPSILREPQVQVQQSRALKVQSNSNHVGVFHVRTAVDLNHFPLLKKLSAEDPEFSEKLNVLDFMLIEKSMLTGRPIEQLRNDIFGALQVTSEAMLGEQFPTDKTLASQTLVPDRENANDTAVSARQGNVEVSNGNHRRLQGVPAIVELTQNTIDSLAIAFGSDFLQTSLASLQTFLISTNLVGPGSGPAIPALDPNDPNPPTFEEVVGTAGSRTLAQLLQNFGVKVPELVTTANTLSQLASNLNATNLSNALNNLGEIAEGLNATDVIAAANKLSAFANGLNDQALSTAANNLGTFVGALNATVLTAAVDNVSAASAAFNPQELAQSIDTLNRFVVALNSADLSSSRTLCPNNEEVNENTRCSTLSLIRSLAFVAFPSLSPK